MHPQPPRQSGGRYRTLDRPARKPRANKLRAVQRTQWSSVPPTTVRWIDLSLYSVCDGKQSLFLATNPSSFVRPLANIDAATITEIEWARRYSTTFDKLIEASECSAAMRCYGNARLLPNTMCL